MKSFFGALLLAAGALGCRSINPEVLSPGEIPNQVRALPSWVADLDIRGLAFCRDKLYVGTCVGLVEIEGHRARALYQWRPGFHWMEGPWVDRAADALWFRDVQTAGFRRWDGREWTATALTYQRGYQMRFGVRSGFRGASNAAKTWLEGAGYAWSWDRETRDWVVEDMPSGSVFGVAPAGDGLYAFLLKWKDAHETMRELELHFQDGQRWVRLAAVPAKDSDQVRHLVGATAGGFYLSGDGRIVRFDRRGFQNIEQPGDCEAMTSTTDGNLLGSFRGKGIFERRGEDWKLLHRYPVDDHEGKHRAFLAESKGVIALATTFYYGGPQSRSGTCAVWVSKGDLLERVPLE